jgi:tripartite-type tricarboxylate transporter receptor subunit TctC
MSSSITRRSFVEAGVATVAAMPFGGTQTWAQSWPSKPIKVICGSSAGGTADLFARAYGEYLSQTLGQPVVVENKPGVAGALAAQAVKASPADGHTLLFTISVTLIGNRVLYKNLGYDPDKDFVLISSMSPGSLVFMANKSTGATTLQEFIEYARKNRTSVGTWGAGSGGHVAVAELNRHYGLQMEAVHYRGGAPMFQDFNAGVIHAAQGTYYDIRNSQQTGTGHPIAVWPRRCRKLPDVPTFLERGVNSRLFNLAGYFCLLGPTGMPQEIVERLSNHMVEGGKSERVQRLLDTLGIDEGAQGHAAFRKLHETEMPIWIELIGSLGLTPS